MATLLVQFSLPLQAARGGGGPVQLAGADPEGARAPPGGHRQGGGRRGRAVAPGQGRRLRKLQDRTLPANQVRGEGKKL